MRKGLHSATALEPVLEVLTLSKKCTFPNNCEPLVTIFGKRLCFQPILYFYELDILLTTPSPIQYTTGNRHDWFLSTLYVSEISSFPFEEAQLATFSKFGWMEAVGNAYADSVVYSKI